MPRRTAIKWPGVLGKPIGPQPMAWDASACRMVPASHKTPEGVVWWEDHKARFVALAKRYGLTGAIDEDFWRTLALSLADEVVPGFNENPRGRKREHTTPEARDARRQFLVLFEATQTNDRAKGIYSKFNSADDVLRELSKPGNLKRLPQWFRSRGCSVRSLRNALSRARAERDSDAAFAQWQSRYTNLGFGNSPYELPAGTAGLLGSVEESSNVKPGKK